MKALGVVLVLLLIGIAGFGFCRGWFSVSTDNTDHKPSATITMDKDRIQKDEQIAKEKVHNFGQAAKEKTAERADKVTEPERR
jgi:hypothetical protein